MRVGLGIDTHQLIKGDLIRLCGVDIPSKVSIKAHSDGDVLLHALGDALLGAAALGDLGQHFPDTDPRFADVSSLVLVEHILTLLAERQFSINNIDATVIAEQPRLSVHMTTIRHSVAKSVSLLATKLTWPQNVE